MLIIQKVRIINIDSCVHIMETVESNELEVKKETEFSAVVFDFDGTLANSFEFILFSLEILFS